MEYSSEEDFVDFLADEVEKADKAVKKVRNALRALRAQTNRALEEQLETAEARGTEQVQETLAIIKSASSKPGLSRIGENEEFLELKATFKKVVRSLNVCLQDIQQRSVHVSYDTDAGGEHIDTVDAGAVASGDLELEMVFNSEQVDVDAEIAAENRQDAMQLAQDTVVLRDMMKDTVELIEEQGEQLKEVDETVEDAAETTEQAVKELEAARGHQKATQKLKIIIGSICGCLVLTAIIVLCVLFVPSSPAALPSASGGSATATTTTAPPASGSGSGTGTGSGSGTGTGTGNGDGSGSGDTVGSRFLRAVVYDVVRPVVNQQLSSSLRW